MKPGDTVLTVSHSFIASANVVRYCQAEPFFVDIEPGTYNLDPAALAVALKEHFEFRGGEYWLKGPAPLLNNSFCPWQGPASAPGPAWGHHGGPPARHAGRYAGDLGLGPRISSPVVEDAACALGSRLAAADGGAGSPSAGPTGRWPASACTPAR